MFYFVSQSRRPAVDPPLFLFRYISNPTLSVPSWSLPFYLSPLPSAIPFNWAICNSCSRWQGVLYACSVFVQYFIYSNGLVIKNEHKQQNTNINNNNNNCLLQYKINKLHNNLTKTISIKGDKVIINEIILWLNNKFLNCINSLIEQNVFSNDNLFNQPTKTSNSITLAKLNKFNLHKNINRPYI